MKRIIWHWTAGGYKVDDLSREHYHYIIDGDGVVSKGIYSIEDNESASDGKYAAHTLGCNTGSIGISVCCMAGATEANPSACKYPPTIKQIDSLCQLSAQLCCDYGIKVSPTTTLCHSEVQANLKIQQRGKWDINWVPFSIAPCQKVGEYLRSKTIEYSKICQKTKA